jgi:transcriptional regulator with XRE-family HTH domain
LSSSPLVRRLRLGAALRDLRKAAGNISAEELGKRLGWSRIIVTRLESDDERKPDVGKVMSYLEACGVDEADERYRTLVRVARDAAETGWWEARPYARMGARLARIANLETGAKQIREFQLVMLPGLVQTPAMARYLAEVAIAEGDTIDLETNLAARKRRQGIITDPDGADYELIVEEQAVRRLIAPANIMAEQLAHVLALAERPNVTVRVMPVDARLEGLPPRTPFGVYSYADPGDPTVVAVDTVTEDLLITEPGPADRYVRLWKRLHDAALSPKESAEFISTVASSLPTEARP